MRFLPAKPTRFYTAIFALVIALCAVDAYGQNSKGDVPKSNSRQIRESRFKTRHKQGDKARTKDIAGRRLRTLNQHSSSRARLNNPVPATTRRQPKFGSDRPSQGTSRITGARPTQREDRAWKGDSKGNRLVIRGSAANRASNVYPSHLFYIHKPSRGPSPQKPKQWLAQNKRVNIRSPRERAQKNYNPRDFPSSAGRSISAQSHKTYKQFGKFVRSNGKPPKNKSSVFSSGKFKTQPPPGKGGRKRLNVQSATRSYTRNKSINAWANYPKPKQRSNIFNDKDISGHKLLKKNFQSPRQGFTPQLLLGGGHGDDRMNPARWKRPGSATRFTPRAWSGDIAGRRIVGSKQKMGDHPYGQRKPGAISRTLTGAFRSKNAIPVKGPGRNQFSGYKGNVAYGKSFSAQGAGFAGNIKARRPGRGGGSISGRWNNKGQPILGKGPGNQSFSRYQGNIKGFGGRTGFSPQGANYAGNIKAGKQIKGGGSISGRWNNKGQPIVGKSFGSLAQNFASYQGNIKGYAARTGFGSQGANYAGNIKARKPQKGGGSISGFWNNDGSPVVGRVPRGLDQQLASFNGGIKQKKIEKGGGSISDRRFNNNGQPLQSEISQGEGSRYRGSIKQSIFVRHYVKNPNAADEALKKKAPSQNAANLNKILVKVREPDHHHNSNSPREALDVYDPGRAGVKIAAYQGNVKMNKFKFFTPYDAHPDSRFADTRTNAEGNRKVKTNVMLFWSKLFGKGKSIPDNLKEKPGQPRFDKGEQGMWND